MFKMILNRNLSVLCSYYLKCGKLFVLLDNIAIFSEYFLVTRQNFDFWRVLIKFSAKTKNSPHYKDCFLLYRYINHHHLRYRCRNQESLQFLHGFHIHIRLHQSQILIHSMVRHHPNLNLHHQIQHYLHLHLHD